jgi:hypothetical protein
MRDVGEEEEISPTSPLKYILVSFYPENIGLRNLYFPF